MSKTRVVLVRHGESIVTVRRVLGGPRTCVGLSDLGKLQAAKLRDRLASTKEIDADVLISSAYPRALQTADIIKDAFGFFHVVVDPNFGEHDPGPECDGLTFDEFVRRHGRPDWGGDPHAVVFPGGETIAQFHDRVHQILDQITRTMDNAAQRLREGEPPALDEWTSLLRQGYTTLEQHAVHAGQPAPAKASEATFF